MAMNGTSLPPLCPRKRPSSERARFSFDGIENSVSPLIASNRPNKLWEEPTISKSRLKRLSKCQVVLTEQPRNKGRSKVPGRNIRFRDEVDVFVAPMDVDSVSSRKSYCRLRTSPDWVNFVELQQNSPVSQTDYKKLFDAAFQLHWITD
jgi:hypothetical protein